MADEEKESKSETLGERIAEVRTEQGVSVEDAASRAGIEVSIWQGIESGIYRPKLNTVWTIASALSVRPVKLFK